MSKQVINVGSFAGDPSAESIRNGGIKLNDMMTELYDYRPFNVMDFGAKGDSSYVNASGTDDTAAFQAAVSAAVAVGGTAVVQVPGRRSYKLASTLSLPTGVYLEGLGGKEGNNTSSPPVLVWGGSAGGTMIDCGIASQNIFSTKLINLTLTGRTDQTNLPACLVQFRGLSGQLGSLDTGSGCEGVLFQMCNGDGLRCTGATNFYLHNCRWDGVFGYGIYADLNHAGGVTFSCTISGNCTWTTGGNAKGFMFLDSETSTAGSSMVKIIGIHLEVENALVETFAGGTNPYDRRGLIRLGVNSSSAFLQHKLQVIGLEMAGNSGIPSWSVFQVTATGGTDLDNARMVDIIAIGGYGTGGTNEAGTNDEKRIIGGRIPADERPKYTASSQWQLFMFGLGKNYDAQHCWSIINSRSFIMRTPVIQPTTVAQLPGGTDYPKQGMKGFVTDANATTFNSVVAGGGSNKVPVFYDGTSWRIG